MMMNGWTEDWDMLIDMLDPDADSNEEPMDPAAISALIEPRYEDSPDFLPSDFDADDMDAFPNCTFCMKGDHFIDECPEVAEWEAAHDEQAFDDGWDNDEVYVPDEQDIADAQAVWDEMKAEEDAKKNNEPVPLFYEDENQIVIPTDPFELCYERSGTLIKCNCEPDGHDKIECKKCKVGREWPSYAWRPFREDGEYDVVKRKHRQQKQKKKQPKPATTVVTKGKGKMSTAPGKTSTAPGKSSVGATSATSYGTGAAWTSKDRHYGDTYTLYDGSVTLYVSSMWNTRKEDEFVPDFGLYFDWGWHPYWRNEHIDWPDYNIPRHLPTAFEQILEALERAQNGENVEVGCIGAHGRTGTALAVMNVIMGADADTAINHVRDNHCEHAIESKIQEWMIDWVYAVLNDKPIPEKPEYKPKYQSNTWGGTTVNATKASCQKADHFQAWLWVPAGKDKFCPQKGATCEFWDEDVAEFEGGKYPKFTTTGTVNYSTTAVIGDYLVPKAIGKGAIFHTPQAKEGCKCDTCRYLELGHGAFLCPKEYKPKQDYLDEMDALENEVMTIVADRKRHVIIAARKEAMKTSIIADDTTLVKAAEGTFVYVAQSNGEILKIPVNKETWWKTKPLPDPENDPTEGERHGEWVWTNERGWVLETLAKLPIDKE